MGDLKDEIRTCNKFINSLDRNSSIVKVLSAFEDRVFNYCDRLYDVTQIVEKMDEKYCKRLDALENQNADEALVNKLSTAKNSIETLKHQLENAEKRIMAIESTCAILDKECMDEKAKNQELTSQLKETEVKFGREREALISKVGEYATLCSTATESANDLKRQVLALQKVVEDNEEEFYQRDLHSKEVERANYERLHFTQLQIQCKELELLEQQKLVEIANRKLIEEKELNSELQVEAAKAKGPDLQNKEAERLNERLRMIQLMLESRELELYEQGKMVEIANRKLKEEKELNSVLQDESVKIKNKVSQLESENLKLQSEIEKLLKKVNELGEDDTEAFKKRELLT